LRRSKRGLLGGQTAARYPIYENAELFQHLSHALMPVICPTGQILFPVAMKNDVV